MRREVRSGSVARGSVSGTTTWDIVDEQFDKSWNGAAANNQAARLQWLERELSELRGRIQQQEQGACASAVPAQKGTVKGGEPVNHGVQHECQGALHGEGHAPPPLTKATKAETRSDGMELQARDSDLRSVSVVLPKLPEEGSHQAALRCGDWLAEITPLVADVSSHAVYGGASSWTMWVRCTKDGWTRTPSRGSALRLMSSQMLHGWKAEDVHTPRSFASGLSHRQKRSAEMPKLRGSGMATPSSNSMIRDVVQR